MGAISALSTAVGTLKRNGVVFGAAFVVAVVNFALTGVTMALPPDTAALVSLPLSGVTYLFVPFFVGGLLAVADEGLDGHARFRTFVAGGRSNYLRLLAAMVLLGVLITMIMFVALIAVVIVAVFAVGVGTTDGGSVAGGSVAVLVLFGLATAVVTLLPVFVFQFYAAALVVSDLGVVDSFERSARLVRRNLVSTLGYTALTALVGLVTAILGGVVGLLSQPDRFVATGTTFPEVTTGTFLAVTVVAVAVTTVVSAFASVYQVAFYDDCLERTSVGDDGAAVDASVDVM